MKRRILWFLVVVVSSGIVTGGYLYSQSVGSRSPFRTAPVTRGSLVAAVATTGTLNAVMWNQELWFNDFLVWSTEVFSPLSTAITVRAGDRIAVALDESWRATNALSL